MLTLESTCVCLDYPKQFHRLNTPFLSQSFELDFLRSGVFWYPAIIIMVIIGILNRNKNNWEPKTLLDFKKSSSND